MVDSLRQRNPVLGKLRQGQRCKHGFMSPLCEECHGTKVCGHCGIPRDKAAFLDEDGNHVQVCARCRQLERARYQRKKVAQNV